MGFDIQMVEPPTKAEVSKHQVDEGGYYRFNFAAMPVMVVTMVAAGAIVEEEAPAFPHFAKSTKNHEALGEAVWDPASKVKLTAEERKAVVIVRDAIKVILSARSVHTGKVPSFKFAGNEGFVVTAPEAAIIATKLKAYASTVKQEQLAELERIYAERQKRLNDAMTKQGDTIILGNKPLGMTLEGYKGWILDWAAYNEVASHHAGYHID